MFQKTPDIRPNSSGKDQQTNQNLSLSLSFSLTLFMFRYKHMLKLFYISSWSTRVGTLQKSSVIQTMKKERCI